MIDVLTAHLDIIQKILLNTLLVSIPEELYIVMFTLILMGEFDYWKEEECKKLINRWDYARILIPTISVALLLNIMRYTGTDIGFASIIPIALLYILIILTNDVLKDSSALKWMGKALIFLMIGLITVGISELIYIPFIVYGTGKDIAEINNDIFMNFLVSIPSRAITYAVLVFLITKKRTSMKVNVAAYIAGSTALSFITIATVVLDLSYIFFSYKIIVYDKVLIDLFYIHQLLMIIAVIMFPVLNITALLCSVYYVENRAAQKSIQAYKKLHELLDDLNLYANNGSHSNVSWKLNEIGIAIDKVAESLYINNKKEVS